MKGLLFPSLLFALLPLAAPDAAVAEEKVQRTSDYAVSAADLAAGEKVYQKACHTCHGAGIMGAPKFGDQEAWSKLVKSKGMPTLVKNAISGFTGEKGVMPPKGGFTSLSDQEVEAAVAYMVKGNVK